MTTRFTKPTPCRFTKDTEERLRKISEMFGIKPAALIRYAVDSQLEKFQEGGAITIRSKLKPVER